MAVEEYLRNVEEWFEEAKQINSKVKFDLTAYLLWLIWRKKK